MPGAGLLLLRAAVGAAAFVQGAVYLADPGDSALVTWAAGLLAISIGISILIGFLTPVAGVAVGLGSAGIALSWVPPPAQDLFNTKLSLIFMIIMAAAIALLGPGAFSLDARLFGRREIIIPHSSSSPKP